VIDDLSGTNLTPTKHGVLYDVEHTVVAMTVLSENGLPNNEQSTGNRASSVVTSWRAADHWLVSPGSLGRRNSHGHSARTEHPCVTYFSSAWPPKIFANCASIESSKLIRLGSFLA